MLICGRYEATGGMKAGGMSQTYSCLDARLNRRVILKRLQTGEDRRRLNDEKKALLKIRSNHVVQLLDFVKFSHGADEIECLVLEHIDGNDLKEGELELNNQYYSTVWQIAKGLAEIHAAGIIHRDLKPNNIRRDHEGIIKIIDFGLSRETGVDNKTLSSIGYVPYMAPELKAKPPITFTTATDIYSLGVCALSLSKNGLPAELVGLAAAVGEDLVARHLPGIDEAVQKILQQCLSTNPDSRPTATDVVKALERVLLRDQHKARVVVNGSISELSLNRRRIEPNIMANGKVISKIAIEYDGNDFVVRHVVGEAKVNNFDVAAGTVLPHSCVIALKGLTTNWYFATFDVSSPEFMP